MPRFCLKRRTPRRASRSPTAGWKWETGSRGQSRPELGGRLEHFYFAFGDHDAFAVADLPDKSAAAFALAVSEAGGASVRTVVLLTPEEVDAAAKHSVEYRPPMEWEARHF